MLRTATMLYFQYGVTPEMKHRLATRHRWVWIKKGQEVLAHPGDLAGPCDWTSVSVLASELKAINPRVKVGMYAGGLASPDSHHPTFEWLDDADLLHAHPVQPVTLYPTQSPAEPGSRRVKVINYARPETRAKLIACWRSFLDGHNLDGVFFDTFHPEYYAAWMRQLGYTAGGVEGSFHTEAWWAQQLSLFCWQLRWTLGLSDHEVWVNGLLSYPFNPNDPGHQFIGKGFSNVTTYASGLLSEFAHRQHLGGAELRDQIEVALMVVQRHKSALWFYQPQTFQYTDPGHAWTEGTDLHRYYLAAHLLVTNPPYTLFGYHPYEAYRASTPDQQPYLFDGGEDWDRDYGVPVTGVNWTGDVAWKGYSRGYAVVNASDQYGTLSVPIGAYRNWHPTTGGLVEITASSPAMNVPPKAGLFLWRQP